jgi:hypothetical protein
MALASQDPRRDDLLLEALKRIAAAPSDHEESWMAIVGPAAGAAQARALPVLEQMVFGPDYDWSLQCKALRAVGKVHDPASMRLLLRAYDADQGQVRDSVRVLPEHERYASYHLYLATRFLEPLLVDRLRSGPPDEALDAYALVRREARYGPVVEPSRVSEALRDFASRGLGVTAEEIRDTVRLVERSGDSGRE